MRKTCPDRGRSLRLSIALTIMLGGCMPGHPPLPILGTVPAFELISSDGNTTGSREMRGTVWIAGFIYTTCPGPCPLVVRKMRSVNEGLGAESPVRIVAFSVDPQHDTAEVLKEYAGKHGLDGPRFSLLTGQTEDVISLIRSGFHLATGDPSAMLPETATEAERAEVAAREGPVVHSAKLALVDDALRIRGYYDTNDGTDMEKLLRDAGSLAIGLPTANR